MTTRVEPGCISAITRPAVSGARSMRFMVSEASSAEASTTLLPAGRPTASHFMCRGSESGPVSVKACVPNGFSGNLRPTGAVKLCLPLTKAVSFRSAVEITNDEAS